MQTIQINQLGLAAYVKLKGAKLLKVENKVFHFESSRSTVDWRTEYANSECMKHDSLVCDLRNFIRKS